MSDPDPPGLWDKLRRRKVVQWGIAYVAAGWGLLQGLAYVGSAFHWPEQIQRFAIVAFIVGLPIALVVAWYHGDRGHQKVTGTEFAILTGLLLIGGGMFWWLDRMPPPAPAGQGAQPTAAGVGDVPAIATAGPSIAVLPFVNMSSDKDNEYFSDGITEELLNVLVRVPGLGVASRTSSFAYKGSKLGAAEIAKELKVNHVLEGSVRKSGSRVRITAQLIDASNDRHLWSQTYDRELDDIFAIQEEISNAIVDALQSQLGAKQTVKQVTVRADTQNVEAYEIYLKARELFISRADVGESIRLFEKVTELDPNFARGWEGYAAACSIAGSWGVVDRDYDAMAAKAAHRALELDPSLSMPWAALSNVEATSFPIDWQKVLALLDKALAADPRNSTALLWRAIAWSGLGFFDRSIVDLEQCLRIEPLYHNCARWKALDLLWSGRTDEALEGFRQGVGVGFVTSHAWSFVVPLARRGELVAATLLLNRVGATGDLPRILVKGIQSPTPPKLSPAEQQAIDAVIADRGSDFMAAAGAPVIYYFLQRYDKIATALDLASDYNLQWDRGMPGWLNSPAYKAMLERLGVPQYWRKHGFPPQCKPVGRQDYTCN